MGISSKRRKLKHQSKAAQVISRTSTDTATEHHLQAVTRLLEELPHRGPSVASTFSPENRSLGHPALLCKCSDHHTPHHQKRWAPLGLLHPGAISADRLKAALLCCTQPPNTDSSRFSWGFVFYCVCSLSSGSSLP